MIRVTIEMWPAGDRTRRYTMHIIDIWNDVSKTVRNPRRGDYKFSISRKLRTGTTTIGWWRHGKVENFPRAQKNALHLLYEVLKEGIEGDRDVGDEAQQRNRPQHSK